LSAHISSSFANITGNAGIIALINKSQFSRQDRVHLALLTACTNPNFLMVFVRCLIFEFVHELLLFIVSGKDIESGVVM
jgi:hypothetical protein